MISGSIAVLFVLLLFNELALSRLSFRVFRKSIAWLSRSGRRVLVVGASELAESAARYLSSSAMRGAKLVGFIDVDSFKAGKTIHGAPVLGALDDLASLLKASQFTEILIATSALETEAIARIAAFARANSLAVFSFSIALSEFRGEAGALSGDGIKEIPLGELATVKSLVA